MKVSAALRNLVIGLLLSMLPGLLFSQKPARSWLPENSDLDRILRGIWAEETRLAPLSPLSEGWLETVEELGETMLELGVAADGELFDNASSYLFRRAAFSGHPDDLIRSTFVESRRFFAGFAGESTEALLVAILEGSSEVTVRRRIDEGEGAPVDAVAALRVLVIELITAPTLEEKTRLAGRGAEAVELLRTEEAAAEYELDELPRWELIYRYFSDAASAAASVAATDDGAGRSVPAIGDGRREVGNAAELGIPAEVGIPEQAVLPLFDRLPEGSIELLIRYDGRIALTLATLLDRYRWELTPVPAVRRAGEELILIARRQRDIRRRLLSEGVDEQLSGLLRGKSFDESEQLLQEMRREGERALSRFADLPAGGESRRWALLSILSQPLAQVALFEGEDEDLRDSVVRAVEELYGDVDRRARELMGVVMRRYPDTDWEYEIRAVADSFDRIVRISVSMDPEEAGGAAANERVAAQLSDAYYRAFNLVTNPEQNVEARGRGMSTWSMLHGQYVEPRISSDDDESRLGEYLSPWFLAYGEAEAPRDRYAFGFRGYQRLFVAQQEWTRSDRSKLPIRMMPEVSARLALTADWARRLLSGSLTLFALEARIRSLVPGIELPPQTVWLERLTEERIRHTELRRRETTATLLLSFQELRESPDEYESRRAAAEATALRVQWFLERELLRVDLSEELLYERWIEATVDSLLEVAKPAEVISVPEGWVSRGIISDEVGRTLYRAVSEAGIRRLRGESGRELEGESSGE